MRFQAFWGEILLFVHIKYMKDVISWEQFLLGTKLITCASHLGKVEEGSVSPSKMN